MKIKLVSIVITVLCTLAIAIPVLAQCNHLSPEGGDYHATGMQLQHRDNVQDNTLPDEPIEPELIEPEVETCGQYAEWGGHPCPQNDNATPPAYNNRKH